MAERKSRGGSGAPIEPEIRRGELDRERPVPGDWGVPVALVGVWPSKRGAVLARVTLRVGPVYLRSGSILEDDHGHQYLAPPASRSWARSKATWFKHWTVPRELAWAVAAEVAEVLGWVKPKG